MIYKMVDLIKMKSALVITTLRSIEFGGKPGRGILAVIGHHEGNLLNMKSSNPILD